MQRVKGRKEGGKRGKEEEKIRIRKVKCEKESEMDERGGKWEK